MSMLTLFISPGLDAPGTVVVHPTANQPPTLHLHPHRSSAFCLPDHTELGFKTCSTRTQSLFKFLMTPKDSSRVPCKGSGPNIIREKRNRKCSYLFQDAGEPLGLTVNDNLSLLPLVQILEHFQERGLGHGLHVHGGHQPIPLCCRVQNLLQH